MAQEECVIFDHLPKQKQQLKTNQKEFFDSVFSYGKLTGSSLTYVLVFVVRYLKLYENIDQMPEITFYTCYFIEIKLMASLFCHMTNRHF